LEACNQKYCWKNTNYPQTNPGIKKISSWRRGYSVQCSFLSYLRCDVTESSNHILLLCKKDKTWTSLSTSCCSYVHLAFIKVLPSCKRGTEFRKVTCLGFEQCSALPQGGKAHTFLLSAKI
jgi:hypothetical protein